MKINYQLTQRDFYESFMAHFKGKRLMKWGIGLVLAFVMLGVVANIWMYFTNQLKGSLSSAIAPPILLILVWVVILWGTPRWSARNQFTKQPSAQGPRTMTVDDTGMHLRWDGGSSDIEWRNLVRFLEAKRQFLLYTSPACFNILPKRDLNPAELGELRAVLEQNIGKGK